MQSVDRFLFMRRLTGRNRSTDFSFSMNRKCFLGARKRKSRNIFLQFPADAMQKIKKVFLEILPAGAGLREEAQHSWKSWTEQGDF